MKAVTQRVPSWPKLDGHRLIKFIEVVRVMVILITDEELVIVFGVLFPYLVRRFVSAVKYKVNGFPAVIEVLLFQFVR